MGKKLSRDSVQFEKHLPERRRGAGGRALCGGGCCCCSCCLHSLGGLIGAAAATARSQQPADGSIIGCYWTSLALLTAAFLTYASSTAMGWGIVAVLVVLPILQLGASILTLIWIGLRSANSPNKKSNLLTLGRITLWSFIGALAGAVAMIVGALMVK